MNVYIWTDKWASGKNTIAYFPFSEDTNDYSGNGVTLSGIGTKQTIGYSFSTSCYFTNGNVNFYGGWYNVNSVSSVGETSILEWAKNAISYYAYHADSSFNHKIVMFTTLAPTFNNVKVDGMSSSGWHYLAYSYINSKMYLCKDGEVLLLYNGAGAYNGDNVYLQVLNNGGSGTVTFSNIIAESVGWTEQQMTAYYNQTKSLYGIS